MEEPLTNNEKEDREKELRKIRLAFLNILEDSEEERKKAVEEKNKTLAIIKNFTDGLLVLGGDNKVRFVSPTVEKFLRQKEEEIIGKNIFDVTSELIDLKPLKDVLKGRNRKEVKESFRKEIALGDSLILEVSTASFDFSSKEKGTLTILHDISRDKLIEKMKTEFVSISAHQLRTPLSAIKWTLRMILDGDVGKISKDQRDLLEKTYDSNERMILLINDLLNVTRIEEGRFLFNLKLLRLEEVVDNIVKNLEEVIKAKQLTVEVFRPKELMPEILADKEKLGLAIQNLIENSIKYTFKKGNINIFMEKWKDDILFKIKDSGVGIPKDQQQRIFSKFFRGSNVVRMETEGSGLGLYMVKNIIEAHQGKIWFDSKENNGSTFYFILPIKNK